MFNLGGGFIEENCGESGDGEFLGGKNFIEG
jgi:hypothetical protein